MAYGFWSQSRRKEKKKHKKQGGEGEHMVERGVRGVCCLNKKTRQYEDRHGHEIWHGR